jgi:hypothetical protein
VVVHIHGSGITRRGTQQNSKQAATKSIAQIVMITKQNLRTWMVVP